MFVPLFDRILWPLVVYFLVLSSIYGLRNRLPSLLTAILCSFATLKIGRSIAWAVLSEGKLDRLGQRASQHRKWALTPFNVGMLCEAASYSLQQRADEWWWSLFARHKMDRPFTSEAIFMGSRYIYTADEENIKAILAAQFGAYGKGSQFRKEWKDFLGLSIFTTDGTLWHTSRQLLRPQFSKGRMSDLEGFEKHIQILLPLLAGSKPGATVHADDLFYRFTLDAITGTLLGQSAGSLQNELAEFGRAFTEVQRVQSVIASIGPMAFFVPKKRFSKALAEVNTFIESYVDRALELRSDEPANLTRTDYGFTFLHTIATYSTDREVLRDQIVAVLLAGRDTTACTLSWLFYELSLQPRIVEKLRAEVVSHVGLSANPSYRNLKDMRYLQHTLNETLRLYPAVPYNVRVALQDTTLPRGGGPNGMDPISVLKGTSVRYSPLIMQRRSDIYPPESKAFPHYLTFAPERWDHWRPKGWTYIPFNGGPRLCVGQQFALTEIAYTVVRILQTFNTVECRMHETPKLDANIVLQPVASLDLSFSRT